MAKRYTPCTVLLLFLSCMLFTNSVNAQCSYNGPEPNSTLSPTCASQVTATNGVGAGANIFYTGFVPNTWYYFSLGNQPLTITCGSANFADASQNILGTWTDIFTNPAYMFSPANTAELTVQTSGTWNTTSAALTYQIATPTTPTWSIAPTQLCQNTSGTYSIGGSTYATAYVWTVNGANYINGTPGQTTLTTTSTSITVTFADPSINDTVTVVATNNGLCNSSPAISYVYTSSNANITTQPTAVNNCQLTTAALNVTATGGPLSYQWQYNNGGTWVNVTNGVPTGTTYGGATTASLSIGSDVTAATGTNQYVVIVTSGVCGSDTSSLTNVTVLPLVQNTVNQTICSGTSFDGYSTTGTFVDTFAAANGCDSIRTLNLTVLQTVADTLVGTICQGDTFNGFTTAGFYTDTLTGSNGCDSFFVTHVIVNPVVYNTVTTSLCSGLAYDGHNTSGTFIDTLTSATGCDSIRTLNLTILPLSVDTVTLSICANSSYYGHSTSGTYTDTFTSANGCDSIRTLILTVLPLSSSTINQTICTNQSFDGYSTSGTYVDTLTGANGCDSVRTIVLTVLSTVTSSINATICPGQNYYGHTATGTYVDTLTGSNGCDSIRTLNLILLPIVNTSITQSICPGQNYFGYTATGTYIDTLTSQNGCDSIRTLSLTVLTNPVFNETRAICAGQSYEGHNATGVYADTSTGQNGCDSFHILTLTVNPIITNTVTQTICAGQSYAGHNTTGTFIDTLTAATGCDSIRTLNLTIASPITTVLNDSICFGQSLNGHTTSGTYIDSLTTGTGCDSIVTLNLTVLPVLGTPSIAITGTNIVGVNLPGDTYQWYFNGNAIPGDTTQSIAITQTGNYSVQVTNANGCSITSPAINFVYTPVGIVQLQNDPELSIFPNPASATLNIQVEGLSAESNITISIYNQIGQQVLTAQQTPHGASLLTQLDVQTLASGIYLVQVQQGSNLVRKKLIIER